MSDSMTLWDGLFALDSTLQLSRWICVAMLIRIRNKRWLTFLTSLHCAHHVRTQSFHQIIVANSLTYFDTHLIIRLHLRQLYIPPSSCSKHKLYKRHPHQIQVSPL